MVRKGEIQARRRDEQSRRRAVLLEPSIWRATLRASRVVRAVLLEGEPPASRVAKAVLLEGEPPGEP